MNTYDELRSTHLIISSLKTSTMITAQKYMSSININNLIFINSLLRHYNIKNNKPIKRVFFAEKEVFGSNFSNNDINQNDYIVGNLPNTQATIIKNDNDVYDKLHELQKKYNLEYYILHPQNNSIDKINIDYKEIDFQIYEININKLYDLYNNLLIKYAYMMGYLNLNLYKMERMQNAIDNLNEKIKYAKHKINKDYIAKMNRFNAICDLD